MRFGTAFIWFEFLSCILPVTLLFILAIPFAMIWPEDFATLAIWLFLLLYTWGGYSLLTLWRCFLQLKNGLPIGERHGLGLMANTVSNLVLIAVATKSALNSPHTSIGTFFALSYLYFLALMGIHWLWLAVRGHNRSLTTRSRPTPAARP